MPKISSFSPLTTPADSDELPINDVSGPTTKKMTLTKLKEYLQSLTGWISKTMIDWTSGGIWWEELGRTTLTGVGDTISVTGLTARKNLRIIVKGSNSGQITLQVRFNNDSGSNYSYRRSASGAADTTAASQTQLPIDPGAAASYPMNTMMDVSNETALEKSIIALAWGQNTAGAANAPVRAETMGKWSNTSAQITRVDVLNTGTGDFAIGSQVIILGHD